MKEKFVTEDAEDSVENEAIIKTKKRPWRARVRREAKKARLALEAEHKQEEEPEIGLEEPAEGSKRKKRKRKKNKNFVKLEETESAQKKELPNAVTRLITSRFRFLNEQLYTKPSSEAIKIFANDGEAFKAYHKGYQLQTEKWPTNPVNTIIMDLAALPENTVVADVGCGDAKISQKLGSKFTVHSFDLVAVNDKVVVADMACLPLEKGSVDVAVYCLSLMNTNLSQFIREAHRILKKGGKLKIAEVASRFRSVSKFTDAVEKMGFALKRKKSIHEFFILMTFEKVGKVETKRPLGLLLKPCLYKKR